ncbi:MAG: zincin-like metallopeptidase domain-containing protein [Burkholderiaceae bacterium]
MIAATGADFRIGGARAFYDVGGDYVQVPPQPAFTHQIDFYRTALHELGHWAGSKERLARDQSGWFGSALYAREELVRLIWTVCTVPVASLNGMIRARRRGSSGRMKRYP